LWPIVESERSLRISIVLILASLVILNLKKLEILKKIHKQKKEIYLLALMSTVPAVILWLVSLIHPIFQTRYFGYSAIGVSLLLSQLIKDYRHNLVSKLTSGFLVLVFLLQFIHLNGRGGDFNWAIAESELTKHQVVSPILVSPSWLSPLITYYAANKYEVLDFGLLGKKFAAPTDILCSNKLREIWVISPYGIVQRQSTEVSKLIKRGYEYKNSGSPKLESLKLFSLKACGTSN
jgi:hypothetical protein